MELSILQALFFVPEVKEAACREQVRCEAFVRTNDRLEWWDGSGGGGGWVGKKWGRRGSGGEGGQREGVGGGLCS